MMNCIHCTSEAINKNGKGTSGGQRWRCFDCKKQFSTGGVRGTYSKEFRKKIIDEYCHSPKTARQVLKKYHISSTTLVKWKKDHQDACDVCT